MAFDISALAQRLKGKPKYKPLVDAIGRYQSAQSIEADLKGVKATLDLLSTIVDNEDMRAKFGAALMSSSVIQYCRAVVSDQQGRYRVNATRGFDAEQKAKHEAIANLRNTVLAHFGKANGPYSQRWADERVVLREVNGGWDLQFVSVRANFLADAAQALDEVATVAHATVVEIIEERKIVLFQMLDELADDALALETLQSLPFDPHAFFAGENAALGFLRNELRPSEVYLPRGARGT